MSELSEKVSQFPNAPGVYLMKDARRRVLYVGKAKNLRKRVLCYFQDRPRASGLASASGGGDGGEVRVAAPRYDGRYQVKFLMDRVHDIEAMVTANEREALLLENALIKKHAPRYNLQLKDDKSYPSIKLSVKKRFPRLSVTRTITHDGSLYFGPYPSAAACHQTAEFTLRHFRLRTCSDAELINRVRPCIQHQIGRCDAPCVGKITDASYRQQVEQVKLFLLGKKEELIKSVEEEMKKEALAEEYEKAARSRDLLFSLKETLLRQEKREGHFAQEEKGEILEKLRQRLHLQNYPSRIECFDISNIGGEHSAGSLVSFLEGEADKSHYRRFKIKTVVGPDDFASMHEVLKRRLTHLPMIQTSSGAERASGFASASELPGGQRGGSPRSGPPHTWERPHLIVIDGGKGQLHAASVAMKELNVTGIDLISLAKAREKENQDKIFIPGRKNPVKLGKNSPELHLLMRIRDEAHRFAITYHRKLRAKAFLKS